VVHERRSREAPPVYLPSRAGGAHEAARAANRGNDSGLNLAAALMGCGTEPTLARRLAKWRPSSARLRLVVQPATQVKDTHGSR